MFDMGPNWTGFYSAEEAERDLDLKFKGVGWYVTTTDTLLVLPKLEAGKHKGKFKILCWNIPNARSFILKSVEDIMRLSVYEIEGS